MKRNLSACDHKQPAANLAPTGIKVLDTASGLQPDFLQQVLCNVRIRVHQTQNEAVNLMHVAIVKRHPSVLVSVLQGIGKGRHSRFQW